MTIQLEFCGLIKIVDVPDNIDKLELIWIKEVDNFISQESYEKSFITNQVRLIFQYRNQNTLEGYPIYTLTKIENN